MKFFRPIRFPHRRGLVRNLIIPSLCVASLIFLLQLGVNVVASAQSKAAPQPKPHSPVYENLSKIPPTAQQAKVGYYVQNIYGLEPASNTYYMDFYMWFTWKGDIDPTEKMEFMNGVEDWGVTTLKAYEKPKKLPDGSFYQLLRLEGRFAEPFKFARYPLDQQRLGVTIENSIYTVDQLVYVADTERTKVTDDLNIPGWNLDKYQLLNLSHKYSTNFGDVAFGEDTSTFSALRFEVLVSRPPNYFAWKLLLPLVIVLIASWGALMLDPTRVDSRIALTITTLLTTVFLQQSYSDALPAVSYLVLLDKIYVLAYFMIIAAILEAILTADIIRDEKPEAIARVKQIDRYLLIGNVSILIAGIVLLLLL
ncbi:MAG: hypothetical protein ICV85_11660 [Tolypothrix sp. T3-bin4]|nr:hypothetical protein [Tolypothrix sp. T3-bin4]